MIVVPVDDVAKPSKVFVIEVAQSIKLNNKQFSEPKGILIYSVDATRATGENAIVVYPRVNLNEAAFQSGDTFEHKDAPMSVSIEKGKADVYRLRIHVKE